jgi:hypothetical protein
MMEGEKWDAVTFGTPIPGSDPKSLKKASY